MQASSTAPQPPVGQQPVLNKGFVKQALSGDAVIIRGVPKGGPPPEKQLNLSNITAPRLARRPTDANAHDSKDEPYAWESREVLRKLVGKEIMFSIDYKVPASGREYGSIYLNKDGSEMENVSETLVAEGLAEVRQVGNRPSEALQKLLDLQNSAKSAGKGKWGTPEELSQHVRDVIWNVENPRVLIDSLQQKPQQAVIEHVRDGSTVRAFLLPSFHYVTVMISGIRCPGFKIPEGGQPAEPEEYAEEAKYFTEVRLLQRNVEIILESASNQNYIGSVLHPNGNIAELLLQEGFAKCMDWSLSVVHGGPEKLRAAEKIGKEKKLRIWKAYVPKQIDVAANSFQGKVVEILTPDAIMVKKNDGETVKVWISSIRPPRQDDFPARLQGKDNQVRQFRPLYDIPYMFEAREFLRKKLIGKKVSVTLDYVQPSNNQFPERNCCTVMLGGQNIAESIVGKGYATVVRYRQGDENRSPHYDSLLAAESKAETERSGVHALRKPPSGVVENGHIPALQKEPPVVRVQELQGDYTRSKQFLPYLQRAGRVDGIVEFVASGSRVRMFVPKETCLITFLLSGINCPRGSRPGPGGTSFGAEPFGDEATQVTKEMCLQHEVSIEVEAMDKAGNFVGWMFVNGENLALKLVEMGLAKVHFTAERSKYYTALLEAEAKAKEAKRKLWENVEPSIEEHEAVEAKENLNGPIERVPKYRPVAITEIDAHSLRFWAQDYDNGPKLEQMMGELRSELEAQPPVPGSYTPRKGDLCAARFSADKQWYRARVESVKSRENVEVLFVDFGNREVTSNAQLTSLPPTFAAIPSGAKEYALAFLKPPTDVDFVEAALETFQRSVMTTPRVLLNTEYRSGGVEFVTVTVNDRDIGRQLVEEGLMVIDGRKDARFKSIMAEYMAAQDTAKKERLNIWRYGDFTGDEM